MTANVNAILDIPAINSDIAARYNAAPGATAAEKITAAFSQAEADRHNFPNDLKLALVEHYFFARDLLNKSSVPINVPGIGPISISGNSNPLAAPLLGVSTDIAYNLVKGTSQLLTGTFIQTGNVPASPATVVDTLYVLKAILDDAAARSPSISVTPIVPGPSSSTGDFIIHTSNGTANSLFVDPITGRSYEYKIIASSGNQAFASILIPEGTALISGKLQLFAKGQVFDVVPGAAFNFSAHGLTVNDFILSGLASADGFDTFYARSFVLGLTFTGDEGFVALDVSVVPEPSTAILMLIGLLVLTAANLSIRTSRNHS